MATEKLQGSLADGVTDRCQSRVWDRSEAWGSESRQCKRAAARGEVFCSQHLKVKE